MGVCQFLCRGTTTILRDFEVLCSRRSRLSAPLAAPRASAITPPRTMLYENRYYSKALLPANPGNGQVTSELCYTDAARMRVHGTEPSTPPVTTQQAASFPKPPSEHASPEKARMLPSLYGMPAQEMGNSSKGSLMAQCIDSPGEDGPRRMAIERTMLSVRGKSSNQVRATFVPEDAAPLEGRATTRTHCSCLLTGGRSSKQQTPKSAATGRRRSQRVCSPAPRGSGRTPRGSLATRCSWGPRTSEERSWHPPSSPGSRNESERISVCQGVYRWTME